MRYIDCFAGAGKFEDGSDGSPLIALKEIREAVEKSHAKNKDVKLYFIEKSHSETLKNVLGRDPLVGDVIGGRFEEDLIPLASRFKYANMFLYIDPFGVKLLDFRLLDELKLIVCWDDFKTSLNKVNTGQPITAALANQQRLGNE